MNTTDQTKEVTRRAFLSRAIGASVAFMATALGIPAMGAAVGPALRRTEPSWIKLGRVDSFPEGVPKSVEFGITRRDGWVESTEIKAVWVAREAGAKVTVLNGRCTHLGCAYHWDNEKNQFNCPCHNGVFAKDGRVLGGPPPRPLDPLPTRVEDGILQVQYFDFQLGTAERVPS